ncbi:Retinal Guanylyl Cyclase 1 [Manis pentadactyla]|nr:Retinal Guanylyl Cyclase 1 [Manis pentadactyla]
MVVTHMIVTVSEEDKKDLNIGEEENLVSVAYDIFEKMLEAPPSALCCLLQRMKERRKHARGLQAPTPALGPLEPLGDPLLQLNG